jgi:predicted MFS family arabinose efflux permease
MGTYTAFFDLGVGVTSPLLGLIAGHAGLRAVFLASALVVLCAAAIAMRLLDTDARASLKAWASDRLPEDKHCKRSRDDE